MVRCPPVAQRAESKELLRLKTSPPTESHEQLTLHYCTHVTLPLRFLIFVV